MSVAGPVQGCVKFFEAEANRECSKDGWSLKNNNFCHLARTTIRVENPDSGITPVFLILSGSLT
jgi:hypothetical protein